jgi:hypothetical protein
MPFSPMQKQLVGLAGWLAVSFAAAALGGFASANAGDFYQQLTRPPWAPPTWLFAPAWTLLYLLMGVVAWLVCRERGFRQARTALSLFLIQLGPTKGTLRCDPVQSSPKFPGSWALLVILFQANVLNGKSDRSDSPKNG